MATEYQLVKPPVSPRMYWPEGVLLLLAFVTPIVAYGMGARGLMFSRSGSAMLLFAAIAEFTTLNRINKKHQLNACRAKAGETPWDFSTPAMIVGVLSLIAALLATFIWGYGDLVIK